MARIDGELKNAQLEEVSSLPAGPQPTSRVVQFGGVPYYWNGSTWKQIQIDAYIPPVVAGDQLNTVSATTETTVVDWSISRNQEVILNTNTVISFINPQEGMFHRLVVSQNRNSSTYPQAINFSKYGYFLKMYNQDIGTKFKYQESYVPLLNSSHTYTWVYKAFSGTESLTQSGSGPIFTNISAAVDRSSGSFSQDGKSFIVGRTAGTTADVYNVTAANDIGTFCPIFSIANGISPALSVTNTTNVEYNQENESTLFCITGSPYIQIAQVRNAGGTPGGFVSNPATLPAGAAYSGSWNKFGNVAVVGGVGSPFINMYHWNSGAAPAKVANPTILPSANLGSVAVNKVYDEILTMDINSQLRAYRISYPNSFSSTPEFNSSYNELVEAGSGSIPVSPNREMAWHPSGRWVAYKYGAGGVRVRSFSPTSGYGSPLSSSISEMSVAPSCLNWSVCGRYLIIGHAAAGTFSILVMDFANEDLNTPVINTFLSGTNYYFQNAATSPSVRDIVCHPSGKFMLVVLSVANWLFVVPMPNGKKEYFRVA